MPDPLLVDKYELDAPSRWGVYVAAGPPWHGARFKLSQGLYYAVPTWVAQQRDAFVNSSRYGVDLFDGMYHYLDLSQDGRAQCDYAMQQVSRAGGEKNGTLPLMVDVERGGQRHPALVRQRVVDVVGAFAARYQQVTGRLCTLYGGELLRALGVNVHMGCGTLAVARYTPTLPHDVISAIGWDYPDEWQFCGDGEGYLAGYPTQAPGCGKIDITVVTNRSGLGYLVAQATVGPAR